MAQSAGQLEPTISTTELCAHYRCGARTIRRLAKEARVVGRKGGRERVYPLSEAREIDRVAQRRSGALDAAAPSADHLSVQAERDASTAARRIRLRQTKTLLDRVRLAPRDPNAKVVVADFGRR